MEARNRYAERPMARISVCLRQGGVVMTYPEPPTSCHVEEAPPSEQTFLRLQDGQTLRTQSTPHRTHGICAHAWTQEHRILTPCDLAHELVAYR